MSEEEIIDLITKFYDGKTNDEDEKLLRALVSYNNCPAGFNTEWEYIRFCLANTSIAEPSYNFTDKILKNIDESANRVRPLRGSNRFLIYLSGVAAALLMTFGAYLFMESRRSIKDTYSDPELAYEETMKILMDVSAKLNKGTGSLSPVGKLSIMTDKSLERINHSSSVISKSIIKLNVAIKTTSGISKNDTRSMKK
jgi:hypothetical protein